MHESKGAEVDCVRRWLWMGLSLLLASGLLVGALLLLAHWQPGVAYADPIPPPEGRPKLSLSVKTVTPTLTGTQGAILYYAIEIRNTGAYTAVGATLVDPIPEGTAYNGDAEASVPPPPIYAEGVLNWTGDVGFDDSVEIRFSVTVSSTYSGTVRNTAVVSHPLIAQPVTITAEAVVTDKPILGISKDSDPARPGPHKPMTYTLSVVNTGQPAFNLPITVTDHVPLSTTLLGVGDDGFASPAGDVVTWTRSVTLAPGATTVFSFSVMVDDVPSGTVILNDAYQVASAATGVSVGEPYSKTIIDPILSLYKEVWPDPPGSNREMTYTLSILNSGSLATGLVVTDRVPAGVTYVGGGSEDGGVVTWDLPRLDTRAAAEVTFTVYVSDVMNLTVLNDSYGVCSFEGVCVAGEVLTTLVEGPNFVAYAYLDPIAHKPGGGTGTEVTPTLVVENTGPGNAIDAEAILYFGRISVSANDLYAIPAIGTPPPFPEGPECGDKCRSYVWIGSLGVGDIVTFTTHEGQSTIGGDEGTPFTATVVITDELANMTTDPVTGTLTGIVTHYANIVPSKSAPPVVGPGCLLTYTIRAFNRGLSTEAPPILTDVIPLSTTFAWASDGGVTRTMTGTTFVSWTLPLLSPGEGVVRTFAVQVDEDAVSGTLIINDDYSVFGYGNVVTDAVTSGPPVTTTVREVGLIDSFKEVTPTLALPGPGNVLTYVVHVENTSADDLHGVTLYDTLPWEDSTYQRDATATAGEVVSDIVSIRWTGNVTAFSSELITFTVLVDAAFKGPITNTAVISHASLKAPVVVHAVAYITDEPVLRISKVATPDPVRIARELTYRLRAANVGQPATQLVITDTIPTDTTYVPGSASGGGKLVGDRVEWVLPTLDTAQVRDLTFRVAVHGGPQVVNERYGVICAEGVSASGQPVVTQVVGGTIYLPLALK
jgi:uncharacterized repeat protein (TIGR01451 family)